MRIILTFSRILSFICSKELMSEYLPIHLRSKVIDWIISFILSFEKLFLDIFLTSLKLFKDTYNMNYEYLNESIFTYVTYNMLVKTNLFLFPIILLKTYKLISYLFNLFSKLTHSYSLLFPSPLISSS